MTRVHDAFPAKNAYWTEGGPDINQPDYQTDYTKWADQFNGILNNWARSITAWNVALDEKGKPGYRAVLLRRRHHHRQRDAQDHDQRPVLGFRALFQARKAWGKGICHQRGGKSQRSRRIAYRLLQPRWQLRRGAR